MPETLRYENVKVTGKPIDGTITIVADPDRRAKMRHIKDVAVFECLGHGKQRKTRAGVEMIVTCTRCAGTGCGVQDGDT